MEQKIKALSKENLQDIILKFSENKIYIEKFRDLLG